MSVNIPESIVRISDPIMVTIRYDKLGPTQRSQLARFVETRVFIRRGVVPTLAKGLYDRHFGTYGVGYVHIDSWQLRFHSLSQEDYVAVADAMEQTMMVGHLDESSIKWSEDHRTRRSWMSGDQPTGFSVLENSIAELRTTLPVQGRSHSIYLGDLMSDFMQKDFTKRLTNPKKNTSILTPDPRTKLLAGEIRNGNINSFTFEAADLF